jgi:hypothetical protein
MNEIRAFIAVWLDPIGVIIGLIVTVPILWTWYDVVLGRRRRQRRWFAEARRAAGVRPAVLVVDLLPGKDVLPQVEQFLAGSQDLNIIPTDRRFRIQRQSWLTPQAMPWLAEEIRRCAGAISRAGCDTVHCFYAGPTAAGALIGAEFANGARCLLYQYKQGRYENWGPVRHDNP